MILKYVSLLCLILSFAWSYGQTTPTSKPIPQIVGTPPPFQTSPLYDPSLISQYIRSIFQDSQGHYWFGPASQSVARYNGKTLKYFSREEFFRDNPLVDHDYGNSVHAITEDQQGNIWFGTYSGVVKYNGKSFTSYTKKNGLSNTKVGRGGILVDRSGSIWVGTRSGVFVYDPAADSTLGKCFSLFEGLPKIMVKDIMEDRSGNIWFASQYQGVFRYDGNSILNINSKAGLGDNVAGGMAQDKSGNYWFTMKGGICRYDGKDFVVFTDQDGLGGSEIWGIYIEEESGVLWITGRGSTTRYNPAIVSSTMIPMSNAHAFTVFTEEDGINCCVQAMYQDRSGIMWWGTGQGLYRFDGERFYQVKQFGPW